MNSAVTLAAQARGYAKAARELEDRGESERARELYLKAAKLYNDASMLSRDDMDKNTQRDLAEHLFARAQALKSSTAVSSGGTLEGNRSSVNNDGSSISKDDVFLKEIPNIGFSDIGGLEDVKEEIRKAIIYPFTHKELYQMYGQKAGEGILLYGPPGCGKTMMAKAAAKECGAEFISVKTSTIVSKWVGASEKNIKQIFDIARQGKRSIIFFDEIDSIASRRSESEDYAKRVVNELLAQMDGVDTASDDLLVLAATNEPWAIDPALRRPGRFSKLVFVPEPDLEARKAILQIHLKKRPIDADLDISYLAEITDSYSGADLAAICKEAADIPLGEALRGGDPRKIRLQDFETVLQKRKPSIVSWYIEAKTAVRKTGEEDVFSELAEK
ncbi:transitional endoplasmic reticulum ATPase [Methanolobus vulcani]|uniref:Transitional endoplasmic reticulum ATPase n=1 Tax=Methanolobus vulcani TaxID=38026 RepID=A0A7Z7AX93_9EURY|nr:ATP-binding protein [Methanolobus vulcani]SDF97037.1 transitional endoplasmic reticulum ATPase [Methanolobus vulcani]